MSVPTDTFPDRVFHLSEDGRSFLNPDTLEPIKEPGVFMRIGKEEFWTFTYYNKRIEKEMKIPYMDLYWSSQGIIFNSRVEYPVLLLPGALTQSSRVPVELKDGLKELQFWMKAVIYSEKKPIAVISPRIPIYLNL